MKLTQTLVLLACALPLSGCLATSGGGIFDVLNDLNESSSQMMGTYQAPYLASAPMASGCANRDQRCLILDQTEADLYSKARSNTISWRQLVDQFYSERARQYPSSNDGYGAAELAAYQRVLADRMDRGQISETEWVYFNEQKLQEISSRSQTNAANAAIVRNQQQQQRQQQAPAAPKNCWTTKSGNSFYTTCN